MALPRACTGALYVILIDLDTMLCFVLLLVQVAPDAPEIVAGIQRLAECLDKAERFGDRAASMSSGSPMSTNTHTSGRM
jgi:hypothetical protein